MLRRGQEFLVRACEVANSDPRPVLGQQVGRQESLVRILRVESLGECARVHGLDQIIRQCIDISGLEGNPAHDLHQPFLQLASPGALFLRQGAVAGFFDPLFDFIDGAVTAGFVRPTHASLAQRATDADDAIRMATAAPAPFAPKWNR